jgi:mannan polymerase II complex MNN10 subunit
MSHSSRSVSPLPITTHTTTTTRQWSTPARVQSERSLIPNGKLNNFHDNEHHWAAAKARSAQVRGYPSITTKNEGFFQRSRRKITSNLPVFNPYTPVSANWKEPEKLGRGRWSPRGGGSLGKIKTFAGNVLRRFKFLFIMLSIVTLTTVTLSQTSTSIDGW